jgi:putative tricarboxylic transport membrane protein
MSDKPFIEAEGAAQAAPSRTVAEEAARLLSYLLLIALSGGLYLAARDLPSSRWEPLGAGAFPKLVLATLAFFCAIAAAGSIHKLVTRSRWAVPAEGLPAWLTRHRFVLTLFAAFGLYLAFIAQVGFILASFGFLLLAQIVLAPRTWRSLVIAVAITAVFSYGVSLLFAEVFEVFLPRGQLFR